MADNPFLKSPLSVADLQLESAPEPSAQSATVRRGIAPSRNDLIARAEQLGVDPNLALSFFSQESSGNWNSKDSPKGARGGMQVMPGTYKAMMGTDAGQNDPWMNMEAGLRYISYGMKKLKTNDPELLAAGYHAGYDRPELRRGIIPGTNDGMISTADYARSVAERVRGKKSQPQQSTNTLDVLNKDDPGLFSQESEGADPVLKSLNAADPGAFSLETEAPADDFDKRMAQQQARNSSIVENIADIGRLTKVGINSAAQDVRELVGRIPGVGPSLVKAGDAVDEYFSGKPSDKLLADDSKAMQQSMTPAMQGALEKKWWDSKTGTFGSAWSDPRAYVGGIVQSLPEQALTMVPAMRLAKYAYAGKIAAGASAEVASAAAARAATLAGGVSEGLLGGAQSSREVRDEIMALKPEVLAQSEAYNSLLRSGMKPEEAQTTLANDAATRSFITSGVTTGLFGGMGDRVLAKIFTENVGKLTAKQVAKNFGKAAVGEGLLEEAPQSALQQLSQNEAIRTADPSRSLSQDVLNQTLGGAAIGALQGGGMGAFAGGRGNTAAPPPPAPEQAAPTVEPAAPPAAPSPSEPPAGPLTRATETAATGKDGVREIVGDDGTVYEATTGPGGIKITPKAPSPLTNALEAAAGDIPAAPSAPTPEVQPAADVPPPAEEAAQTQPVEPVKQPEPPKLTDMSDDELLARLKYIADQAKTNGGWNKMLVEQRRLVEKEINARAPKVETPKIEQPTLDLKPAEPTGKQSLQVEPVAQATPAQEATAKLPKELAGAKERYNYGNKGFELKFASDVDRAAFISSLSRPDGKRSAKDADYLAFAMQATGMSEDEVRAHGAQVKAAIKAMAKDASPGTLKVPEVTRGGVTVETTPAPAAEPAQDVTLTNEGKTDGALTDEGTKPVTQPAPIVGTTEEGAGGTQPTQAAPAKPKKASKEDLEHLFGIDKKRATALKRIESGTAFFGSKEKAEDFIKKNGLADTHTVEQTGKVRFDVKAKEQSNVSDERASGQPAGAEAVGEKADAGQAPATPVQPAAPAQKVTAAQDEGQKDELDAEMRSYERRRAEIDAQHKANREALKSLKVGDEVEYTAPGTYTQTDGSKREGRVVRGKIDKIMDADMGLVNVGNATVGARMLRKVEAAPLDAMAQGAEDAKAGKPRTPPAGMTAKQRFQWTQGYDSEAGTTPASQQPKTDTSLFKDNKLFTADAVEKARARLRSKLGNLNSGIDPEVVIDGMTLAGAYIEAGTRSFAAYAKAMVDDFGPKIKPYLLSFYEAARNYPGLDTQGMTPVADAKAEFDALNADEAKAYDQLAELEAMRNSLEDELASQGAVKNASTRSKLNDVIDAIAELKEPAIYKAVSQNGRLALNLAQELRMNEGSEKPQATVGRVLRNLVEPYRTDISNAVLRAIGQDPTLTSEKAEGNDNEPAQLDQSGPRELEGKQPDALQGAEPVGQAGAGSAAGSGADARGNERAGGSGNEQPGRMGNDAGEVPSLAARRGARRGGEQGGSPVQGGDRAAKPDPANAERGNQRELIPTDGTRAQDRADDFTITDEDAIGEGGAKTKFKQNVAAIRLLKQLQAEGRQATRAEQAVLAKYVGWGGIPQAFYRDNGEVSKGWEKEAAELKELMTPDELAAAAASTRNAHYTSPEIVAAVWDAAKHFGFQGGRVLEPSVGVGNFFGLMPSALRSASQLTGVELDHITGGIAKQLYPAANIQAPVGFQDFTAPDNYFDLAIGNPPFGREGIYDAARRKISGFSIHNYFFAKSIDTVKPNGVLAMVVTNRLLDSMGDKARQYIADRAEFLGAIRLPNNAFLKNAGTEVTTDIIFLRKLKDGEQPTGQRWMDVKQFTDKNGKTVPLNEYFVRNPDMMLGEFGAFGSMYSPDDAALVARPGQDTPALLREAMAKLPAGFMDPPTAEPTRETIEPMNDVSHVKVGSVFEQDGQIFERREDMLGKQQAAPVTFASEKAKERVSGMIKVRDALIAVRRLQLTEGVSDKALEEARAGLNKAYDAFAKAHGPINGEANKRLMRDDPTWPQLAALEDDFDKGITPAVAKTTGEKARPPSAKKAAIFFKRTQSPYKAPEKAATAKDALVTSLAERGRVDLDYMASLYGKTPEAIANELEGLIFEVVPGDYVTREEYLSGNVKKRLALTIELAKKFPRFQKNVDALREVQPADIEAVDIDVKTGAHWVPADVMQAFVGHITEGQNVKAIYNPITATWTLDADRVPQSAMTQWGTDRANVLKVLEAAANQKQIQIFDEHRDGTRTMNEAATTAANEKVERVKAEWKNWIWADDARRTRLHRIYNDTFNTDVQRDYDGSHLTFPGKVGNDIISLRPHQANAVWRMVQSGTTLLDHVVGAGKTFTMIAGVMEMRRMGLAKKPMLVVPNHLVGQWAEDFMKLYPGANILAATKKDFEKDNRKKLFARIATGDWDAVIVAHSSFGKVEVEPEFQEAFIRQQINDMDTSISAMRAAEGKSSRNVKQIEKQKAALEEKLKRLFDTGSKDDNLYFGELGVDAVFVDEAHEFKNLGFSTGMQRVAGLGNPTGSNKAADMFMKVQSVLKRTGGKNVVFATGTPISNTMAEMYTMQRYLDYQTLKDQGIAHFDAWAKTFGEVVTDWELSPSGQYKMNSRFAKFVNMPELMQRYQSFADVINRDDINRQLAEQGKKLPVPKVATGKPENIVVERSQDQARYIGIPTVDENGVETYPQGSLVWRAENLPKKAEKGADNMLKIMSDARKAALDMRLIAPGYPDNPGSKVNVAADNIKAIYDKWEADKGTQLVFIDLSTPKGAVAKEAAALRELVRLAEEGDEAAQEKLDAMSPDELLALDSSFSVYDDLKAKLIGLGIPEKEIAFIHDANTELQKEELFAKVRTGRVRVLFGSTAKMGAGMNVQERLVALHHLDAPWRPSDLEQREGRIIRQGNKLYDANPEGFEVRILRYATKQTLDSRMWQTIEAKARFIEQVRKGAGNTREVEDVAGEAANSAEMKAASSGNPLILEEMSLRQAIRKLENSQAEHNREQHRIRDRLRTAADMAKHYDAEAEVMEADAPKAPKAFAVKIGKQTFDKHGEAGEAILAAVDAMHEAGEDRRELGTYGDFKLAVEDTSTGKAKGAVLTVTGQGEYQVEANPGSAATGLALRLQNTVKGIGAEAERARAAAQRNRDDIPKLEAQIKPWGQDQELAEAKARHAAVIEQLKPKKKEQPKQDGEAPAMSRTGLEPIFEALEGRGLTRKRALDALANTPEGEKIAYIDQNFWDILGELEDKGLVNIKC